MTERTMTLYLERDQLRYWWTWKVDKVLMDDFVKIIRDGAAMQDNPFRIEFIEQRLTDYPIFTEETEPPSGNDYLADATKETDNEQIPL